MSTPQFEQHCSELHHIITEVRYLLKDYLAIRRLSFNTEQLFEFMMASPVAFAVAWDERIDEVEKYIMQYAARNVSQFYNEQFTPELKLLFESLPQPEHPLDDKHFQKVLYQELRYLVAHASEWKPAFTQALKSFFQLDGIIRYYVPELKPLPETVVETLLIILLSNAGSDHIEEEKLYIMLSQLGLSFSKELYMRVLNQLPGS